MKPNLILIEGPDGGGKSTLAHNVFKEYVYQHNGPPPTGSPAEVFWWQLQGLIPNTALPTVVDRSWPSEQIYHRFTGRSHTFPPVIQRMFERVMLSLGGVVVMCLPPYDIAYAIWKDRAENGKELLTQDDDFATVYDFYKSWARTSCLDVIEHDFTRDGERTIRERIFREGLHIPENKYPGLLVGNPAAHILIVGEQCNVGALVGRPQLPFIKPDGSSRWFTHELMKVGLRESDLAFTNAITPAGLAMEPAVLKDYRVIITLGKVADEWVTDSHKSGRHHARVIGLDHPAYWSRFRSKEKYPLHNYAMLLNDAAQEF